MRISDWSSDVCSSDLNFWRDKTAVRGIWRRTTPESYRSAQPEWETVLDLDALADSENENWVWHGAQCLRPDRSEEHTSELQSLMRISYAVFCLKKKKIHIRNKPHCTTRMDKEQAP